MGTRLSLTRAMRAASLLLIVLPRASSQCLVDSERRQYTAVEYAHHVLRRDFLLRTPIKLGVNSVSQSSVMSTEIMRVILGEYMQYDVEMAETAPILAVEQLKSDTIDLHFELWPTDYGGAAHLNEQMEGTTAAGGHDCGATGHEQRYGFYIRPEPQHEALILDRGRHYSSLNEILMNLLPSASELVPHCQLPYNTACIDVLVSACADGSCKAVVKKDRITSAGNQQHSSSQ